MNIVFFLDEKKREIEKLLNGKKAIAAVSGGVDSTVAAKIVGDVLGERLLVIYIDTGLMRLDETKNVEGILKKLNLNFKILDASEEFISSLNNVIDPEQKRKIIGHKFIEILEREAFSFGAEYLIQGTIAPDWIESGGGLRDKIKSHHNVGGLPENMKIKIYEPLRDLYKDEVRELAQHFGIPHDRQPFPGPGLAVRIIGKVNKEKLTILKKATKILEDKIFNYKMKPWQYFVVLLNDRSTGVHGDQRVYGYTVAIRIVESIDGMTANFMKVDWEFLDEVSREITNKIPEINRVVYDITDKPPATIEWE